MLKKLFIKSRNLFYIFFGFLSFIRKKKIVCMINGGLGSQMWQYSIGQAVAKKSGMPVVYDLSFYKLNGKDCTGENNRNWDLESAFKDLSVKKASPCDIFFYKRFFDKKYSSNGVINVFIEEILTSKQPRYLGEYYECAKYFNFIEKYLRTVYNFNIAKFSEKTMYVAENINKVNCSVAIQIRRGDFVALGADKTTPPEYFYGAIEKIKQILYDDAITYFIFSNDIPYCKSIFSSLEEKFIFVDINGNDDGIQDMYLMSLCRHFIISSSSFGWWGAFLSSVDSDKIVITPEKWRIPESPEEKGKMLLDGWIGL